VQHPKDADLVAHDVLPLFAVQRKGEPSKPVAFCGSAFLIAPNLLITCHHCVRDKLPPDQGYAAVQQTPDGVPIAGFLENITQHPGGHDLVIANVPFAPVLGFELARDVAVTGGDVFGYGYPLTDTKDSPQGLTFVLNARYLQGYVMRRFFYDHQKYVPTPVYELDMPAPEGLSGAPLVLLRTRRVVGVVFGTHDVGVIEERSYVDQATGQRTPELQRIVSFSLAHHLDVVSTLLVPGTTQFLRSYLDAKPTQSTTPTAH